jgi:hypothetical protein
MGTDYWRPLLDQLRVMAAERTIDAADLDKLIVTDDPAEVAGEVTATGLAKFGLTYGPKVKPRWWLGELFGAWWRTRFAGNPTHEIRNNNEPRTR